MEQIWFSLNKAGAFSGPKKLAAAAQAAGVPNATVYQARKFLRSNPVYTEHRQRERRPRKFKHYVATQLGHLYLMDTMSITGFQAILTEDFFSRKVFAYIVRQADSRGAVAALKSVIAAEGRTPWYITTDLGSEFRRHFSRFLSDHDIQHIPLGTQHRWKASPLERLIRTLRSLMRRIKASGAVTTQYAALVEAIKIYNASYHSAIGCAPNSVTPDNQFEVLRFVLDKRPPNERDTRPLKLGTIVKHAIRKSDQFEKESATRGRTFTSELFRVVRVSPDGLRYTLATFYNNVELDGTFARPQLQVVDPTMTAARIEQVLSRRRDVDTGGMLYKVRFQYRGPEYDRWISQATYDRMRNVNL